MEEVLTMKEIEKRYDKKWVMIGNPVCARNTTVKKGTVLLHSDDRDDLYKRALNQLDRERWKRYNARMEEEISKRFGGNALDKASDDADKEAVKPKGKS